MVKTKKEFLISWLNDAYAMERSIVQTLKNHASDAKDYPALKQLLETHLAITETQAERVKTAIESLGGNVSETKSGFAQLMGMAKEMPTNVSKDELIKNLLSDYATEHFEIASYTSLASAAQNLKEFELAKLCQDIIAEESDMATRLDENITLMTQEFLSVQPD